jgi:tetratricopeptide (TPR) repeat protein
MLLASPAQAQPDDDARARARAHYISGTKFFDLAKYDDAIREYEQAYHEKDDPALLYNLAQAHRLAGHPAEAVHFYKVFLQKLPKAPNREEVALKIRELEKLIEQQQRSRNIPPDSAMQPAQPTPPTPTEHPPANEPPPAATTPPPAATTPPAAEPAPVASSPGRLKKILGITSGALGLGLVAGGGACSGLAVAASNTVTSEARNHQPFDPSQESKGQTLQVVGPVLIGVGALAIAAGVTLYYLGHRESKKAAEVATVRF